jgi:5-(carboxyamino)imidazole ribonucleotide mutase
MSKPVVSIIMGSKSDLSIMKKTGEILDKFGIAYEMEIMSAHRTPEKVAVYAKDARSRGIRVMICGAGMSAHLGGVVASYTDLPVIGVPLGSGQGLNGLDALLSTSQMPKGVPVATVAINGAENAAYLAARILSLSDAALQKKLSEARAAMQKEVEEAARQLKNGGAAD